MQRPTDLQHDSVVRINQLAILCRSFDRLF